MSSNGIRNPLPLITNRIGFSVLQPESPFLITPALITPRLNFGQGQAVPVPRRRAASAVISADHGSTVTTENRQDTDGESDSNGCEILSDLTPQTSSDEEMGDYAVNINNGNSVGVEQHPSSGSFQPSFIQHVSHHQPTLRPSKFEKPKGEPGRPKCGGYNLKSKLIGWDEDLYQKVYVSFSLCLCLFLPITLYFTAFREI